MKYLGTMFLLAALATIGFAQTAPVPQHVSPYHLDSGLHSGPTGDGSASLVFNEIVQVPNTPWNRIRFTAGYLGESSYLVLRSLRDGITQTLDAEALETWSNTSAYFNGDAIELQLFAGTGDTDVFIEVGEVISGEFLPGDTPESQCGPVDDRLPSADARAARLLDIGCTAWLICDGRFISAGHCLSSSSLIDVVQFNVPPSLPNGTIQHPGPEDQYTYVTNSRIYTNGGVGNDWGVFEVDANTTTGLTALDAQGDHFELVQNLTTPTIRITGYGVDFNDGDRNQTQQTHSGPNAGSSGTTMRYQTDTEGGNSGSPVIDEATSSALGVHSHGGCSTGGGGNNSGTSLFHGAFWAEVGNLNCTGGSPIQCDDISFFNARCSSSNKIQAMVKLTEDYDGEIVTVLVDGVPNDVTLMGLNGRSIGRMTVAVGPGIHTVEMADPAGCFDPIEITCGVNNRATAEWDATWAEYDAMEQATIAAPAETRLLGNYPNPFNPSTTISYSVGEATWVTLKVFNTLGQEVATLVDSYQDTGSRTAVWNGLNTFGQRVASGLYIYRLSAGSNIATGRMLLTK